MSGFFVRKEILSVLSIIIPMVLFSCSEAGNQSVGNLPKLVREISSPADSSAAEPFLFTDKQGRTYLSWIKKTTGLSTLYYSELKNELWSAPVKISEGTDWFVNWADFPMIASDGNNNMIAHFLQRSDTGAYTYDIKITSSENGGKAWSHAALLNRDGKKAEHGFVSIIPRGGGFFVSWLDGRNTASENSHAHSSDHAGEMSLRAAYLSPKGNLMDEWELDARVCDCCNTSAALTADGPIVVYRDRSAEEVRDISIIRYLNGKWTKPVTVYGDGWKYDGCPVNGPRVVASGKKVAVAWFTSVNNSPAVSVVFSSDAGATFQQPIRFDEGNALGRIDMVMLRDESVMVSWIEGTAIKAARIYPDGRKDSSIHIASTNKDRASGFPQMTSDNHQLIFAWSDTETKSIRTAVMSIQ